MKKPFLPSILSLVIIMIIGICSAYAQSNDTSPNSLPNPNTNSSPSNPIGQTPRQLGQENYKKIVSDARTKIANLPTNVPLRFPLGTNYPVAFTEANSNVNQKNFEVIGFITKENKSKPITSADLLEMFDRQLTTLNQSNVEQSSSPNSSENTPPTNNQTNSEIPVVDLIVRDQQTRQVYLLPNVRYISVFKDALNGVLNDQLKPSDTNLNNLDIRPTQPNPANVI